MINTLRRRQKSLLIEGMLTLHRACVYSLIDNSLALPGEIDKILKDLEKMIKEVYFE